MRLKAVFSAALSGVMSLSMAMTIAACTSDDGALGPKRDTESTGPEHASGESPPDPRTDPAGPPAQPGTTDAGNGDADASGPPAKSSHFECKEVEPNAYRPYWMQAVDDGAGGVVYKDWGETPKGLLGQNPMTTKAECDQARAAANDTFGVICSRTGLDGWKPTLYTGTVPGRADFGYLGGSSITSLPDCLAATKSSSSKGVCFWGGSDWYVSPIDKEGVTAGPFPSVDVCVTNTK